MKKIKIRKKTVAQILCIVLAICMVLPFFSCMSREVTEIEIVYTGGVHGRVEADKGVVGSALTDAFADQVREESGNRSLVLDCGGFLYGTQMVNLTEGTLPFNILTETGYNAVGLAPSDFSYGGNRLGTLVSDYGLNVLCCNVYLGEERAFSPYLIKKVGRVNIAVVGVMTDDAGALSVSKLGNLTVRDPVQSVREVLEEIGSRADFVIVLSQLGDERARALASEVQGIDLLIEGLGGDALPSGERIGETLLCRAGTDGASVGLARIQLRGTQVYETETALYTGDDLRELTPDETITELVSAAKESSMAYLAEAVGEATVTLDGERASVRRQETNFGDLVADFARYHTGCEVALIPSENLRTSIPAGVISRGSVQTALPLDSSLVRYTVTGQQLWQLLEYSFSDYEVEGGLFPQIGGMRVSANMTLPAGSRVTSVQIGGQPIDTARSYTLVTTEKVQSETAAQLAVEDPLAQLTAEEEYGVLTDRFITYLQSAGPVSPAVDGRLELITG